MGLFDNFRKKKKEEERTYSNLTLDEIKQKQIEEVREQDVYIAKKENEYSKSHNETLNSTTMDLRSWLNENPQAFSVDDNSEDKLKETKQEESVSSDPFANFIDTDDFDSQINKTSPKTNAEFKHTNNGYSRDDEWDLANAIISTDVRPPEDYEENYHHHRR